MVAQVVEHSSEKAGVVSASLTHGTISGSSSSVERLLAKEKAAGSIPVSRSFYPPTRIVWKYWHYNKDLLL